MSVVVAVARRRGHAPGKVCELTIRLVAGMGVEGDAHFGATVQHRSRVRRDPSQPNLRQVHLIASELFTELSALGFSVRPGEMGENITTRGIDLLGLPTGALLRIGATAVICLTGLRNPCVQLDSIAPGLMAATVSRDSDGGLVRRAGVMGVVVCDGDVVPGDLISVEMPSGALVPLLPV